MKRVGSYEAKTHLASLLDEVEAGATVAITRHGRHVASIVPAARPPSDPAVTIAALRELRRGVKRGRTSVRAMIEEGRR